MVQFAHPEPICERMAYHDDHMNGYAILGSYATSRYFECMQYTYGHVYE